MVALLITIVILGSYGCLYSQVTHVFAITEYYYLKLNDSTTYELKIGMYEWNYSKDKIL
jgi:hypothetical protein